MVHYNRILGRGGAEVALAIRKTNDLRVLDMSYNTIGGGKNKKVAYRGQNESRLEEDEEGG